MYPGAENLKGSRLGDEFGGVFVDKRVDAAGKLREILGARGGGQRRGGGGVCVGGGGGGRLASVVVDELLSLPESPAEVF